MPQLIDAGAIRRHLKGKTTRQLCDDYEHLVNATRQMPWAEHAVSMALFERDSTAWFEWMMAGDLFGPAMPHRYFGLK